jgi:hypothetical protein
VTVTCDCDIDTDRFLFCFVQQQQPASAASHGESHQPLHSAGGVLCLQAREPHSIDPCTQLTLHAAKSSRPSVAPDLIAPMRCRSLPMTRCPLSLAAVPARCSRNCRTLYQQQYAPTPLLTLSCIKCEIRPPKHLGQQCCLRPRRGEFKATLGAFAKSNNADKCKTFDSRCRCS